MKHMHDKFTKVKWIAKQQSTTESNENIFVYLETG